MYPIEPEGSGVDLPRTCDAVVIGGGCMGTSAAYHLARRGLRVVLCEQGDLASGTTGRSSGIVRTHYTVPTLVRMAVEALDAFRHWSEHYPGVSGFRETGFLVLLDPGNTSAAEKNVAMQRSFGAEVEVLRDKDLDALLPGVFLDDVGVAAYEPLSGYADPYLTASALALGARDLGAVVATHTAVREITLGAGGRVAGVRTNAGDVSCPIVVNCAGNWADSLSNPLGLALPVHPQRESVLLFDLPANQPEPPIVIDMVNLDYFRPDGNGRLLFGDEDHTLSELHPALSEPDGGSDRVDQIAVENAADKLIRRIPAFGDAFLRPTGYTGCYEVTPDFQPVIGEPSEIPGYLYAAGFSGHGFKLTPVMGRLLSDWIVDGAPSISLKEFDVQRFSEGRTIESAHPYRSAHGLI